MHWVQSDGLTYLQFPALSALPGFFHGIFLRHALDPQQTLAPFNVGMGQGRSQTQAEQNRRRLVAVFGGRLTGVYARQVHGTQVGIWNSDQASQTGLSLNGDALVSAQPAGALVIQTADCQSVILIDPVRRVVANIHSGWRGSIGNIIGRTIDCMTATFGCRPQDLLCGIGPSLGPCCAQFVNYRQEIPQPFWRYRRSRDRFDFWQISMDQLTDSGVPRENIRPAEICTKCNQHLFFSYRGDHKTGRFASVVGIRAVEGKIK
jgi:YfiH family protein